MSQLLYLFKESLKNDVFPEIWKKVNVDPVHKKEDKSLVKTIALSVYVLFLVQYLKG